MRIGFPSPVQGLRSAGPVQARAAVVGLQVRSGMSLENFRTYQCALEFYRACDQLRVPVYLKEQLIRASSSIALNLSEGSAKPTFRDRRKFYFVALGSLRECQAILDLVATPKEEKICTLSDSLGAQLFKLCKSQTAKNNP